MRLGHLLGRLGRGVAFGSAFGLSSAVAGVPGASDVTDVRLKNGLRVVLDSSARDASIVTLVKYDAGSRRDPMGYHGLAHLVEHMTFGGSRRLGPLGMFEELEKVGATQFNAFTNADFACYLSEVPPAHLALPLWVESERMAFSLERFHQKTLSVERERVIKELLQKDRTRASFESHTRDALFPEGHPYRTSLDEVDDVRAIELSDAAWFFQHHYRPDAATVIMTGRFDPERALAEVRKYFEPIVNPPGRVAPFPPSDRAFTRRERLTIESSSVLVGNQVVVYFGAPDPASADHAAFELLLSFLGGRGGGSLRDVLVVQWRAAESVNVQLVSGAHADYVRVSIQARAGADLDALETALHGYFRNLPTASQRDIELQKKARVLSWLELMEQPLTRGFAHLDSLEHRGRPFRVRERIAAVRAVTSRDLDRLARRYLDPNRRFLARQIAVPTRSRCDDGCAKYEVEAPL